MSAFLSKIHDQMYEKIQYLEKLNQQLRTILNMEDKTSEGLILGELSEVIDLSNIHGWLNNQVHFVEKGLNECLLVAKQNKDKDAEIQRMLFEEGNELAKQMNVTDIESAIRALNTVVLDGMPCDRGIKTLAIDEDKIHLVINQEVHSQIEDLNQLIEYRIAWMNGFLSSLPYSVQHLEDLTIEIKRTN